MLKIENNEIKIYRKIDKKSLKQSIILFTIAIVLGMVMSVLSKIWLIWGILEIISIILLLICLNLYKQGDKEKLMYSLSKEAFIIYKKEKPYKEYITSNIESFVKFPSEYNEVVLNFKNEKGKRDSKIFMVQGCKNTDFVEMANEFLKSSISIDEINESLITSNINEGKKKLQESTELINKLVKSGEKIKVALLGKTKQFILSGKSYVYERIVSELVFVNGNDTILSLDISEIEIDLSQISFDNQYSLHYDQKKEMFIAIKENEKLDSKVIDNLQNIRNSVDFKFKLTTDSQIIKQEIGLSNKMHKTTSIFRKILLIVILICALIFLINNKLLPTAILTFMIILCFYPIVLLIIIMKHKKKYLSKKNLS